jgi:MFS family permease
MVGIAVGALIIGRMSDVFGRKIAVTLSIMITAIAQLAGGFTQSYWPYVFTRFLAGAGG